MSASIFPLQDRLKAGRQTFFIRVILLIAVCLAAGKSLAQKGVIEAGVHSGIAMSRLFDPAATENKYDFLTVPDLGITASYGFNKHYSLVAELNYVQIRTMREGLLPLAGMIDGVGAEKEYRGYFKDKMELDYLEIPVMIRACTGSRLRLYFGMGPFVGIRLKAANKTEGASLVYENRASEPPVVVPAFPLQSLEGSHNVTSDARTLNFGGAEAIGVNYSFGKSRIWFEGRYTFGVIDIWKKDQRADVNKTDHLVLRVAFTTML